MRKIFYTLILLLCAAAVMPLSAAPVKSRLASAETDYLSPLPPLPYGAIPVEYIETAGNQWIDTNMQMGEGISCFARHQFVIAGNRQLMGSNVSRQYYGVSADGYIEFGAWNVGKTPIAVDEDKVYGISYSALNGNNVCGIYDEDGGELFRKSGAYFAFNGSFQLFHLHNYNYPFASGHRIFFFSFTDIATEESLLKLIPVRFPNELGEWEGAMYDFVTENLFRNQGTGSFIIGPDL